MRSTFRDTKLQADLEEHGYAVLPMLDPSEVAGLLGELDRLGPAPGDPRLACQSSFHSYDRDYKVAVDTSVRSALSGHLDQHFDRQRALPSNFIVKWPGGMSGFGLHQDLSLVDESEHRSVEVWIALDDTDEANGQLWMVPGSHRWLPGNIRGIHAFPFAFGDVSRRIIERHAVPVPMRAGEALVFNHATLHFSFPNRTDAPRRVAIADLIPEEAVHLHYFGDGNGDVGVYEIDDEFWTANNPFTLWKPPPESNRLGSVDQAIPMVTDDDLERWLAEGIATETGVGARGAINAGKAWCHRCGAVGIDGQSPDRWIGNVTLLCDACRTKERSFAATAEHVGQTGETDEAVATVHAEFDPASLEPDGYATLPLLDPRQLVELRRLFDSVDLDSSQGFAATCNDCERAEARRVDVALKEWAAESLADVLPGHEPFLASFVTRAAGAPTPMDYHQDLTYVDERTHRTLMVWIPLVDVDEHRGALKVVPGSHRWADGIRPGGHEPLPTADLQDWFDPQGRVVPVPAGTAVIFDNALVHSSTPNDDGDLRPAVAIAFRPRAAELLHFHRDGDRVDGFSIGEDFFTTRPFRSRPLGDPTTAPWTDVVTAADFLAHDATATATATAAPTTHRGTGADISGLLPVARRPVLVDPRWDVQLRRDGFVKVQLDLGDAVERVRDGYGELHGWQGSGFEPDLVNDDLDYRRDASALLSKALDGPASSLFVEHVPFLRNYLCKWPGVDSALYLHRDWAYVDERKDQRTYVVWVPLEHVDGHNGQLQVLRRSHRIDSMQRGTSLEAPWIDHDDVIRERLETVPVRLGEAIVFDNALVHCSFPNNTDRPRLVAAVALRPPTAPLIYWRRGPDGSALRHDVDDEFFLRMTPPGLIATPTDLPVAERVAVADRPLTAEQLAELLDGSAPRPIDRLGSLIARVGRRRPGRAASVSR